MTTSPSDPSEHIARFAGGSTCSCGADIVARSIRPETITWVGRERGLVVTETCAGGHVVEFTVQSITMTQLANLSDS